MTTMEPADKAWGKVDEDDARAEPSLGWLDDALHTIAERDGGDRWLKDTPRGRRYLLKHDADDGRGPRGVLAAGRVAFLASAGGVGKSHALCQLALAVAVADLSGTKWLGCFSVEEGGRVLLVMGEEEETEIRRRLFDAAKTMGLNDAQRELAISRIVPMGLAGRTDVALTREVGPGEAETETTFSAAFRAHLESQEWACIILDPLSRFAGGDVEKDNSAATRMVQVLEKFSHLPGIPTVVVAHHTRKGVKGDDSKDADDMRGASGLKDGARFVAVLEDVERPDEKAPRLVRLRVVKNNYGFRPPDLCLARDDDANGALRRATAAEIEAHKEAVGKRKIEAAAARRKVTAEGGRLAKEEEKAGLEDAEDPRA